MLKLKLWGSLMGFVMLVACSGPELESVVPTVIPQTIVAGPDLRELRDQIELLEAELESVKAELATVELATQDTRTRVDESTSSQSPYQPTFEDFHAAFLTYKTASS